MEKKSMSDLRAHLDTFTAEYPLLKGYAAKLLLEETARGVSLSVRGSNNVSKALKKLMPLLKESEPEKCIKESSVLASLKLLNAVIKTKRNHLTDEWSTLMNIFDERFPVTSKILPNVPLQAPPSESYFSSSTASTSTATASSDACTTAAHTTSEATTSESTTSEATTSEATTSEATTSEATTSEATTSEACTISAVSAPNVKTTSLKRLRHDCKRCLDKQRTIYNMTEINDKLSKQMKALSKQMKAQKKQFNSELARCLPKNVKRNIHRYEISISLWKAKYYNAVANRTCERHLNKLLDTAKQDKLSVSELNKKLNEQNLFLQGQVKYAEDKFLNTCKENTELVNMIEQLNCQIAILVQEGKDKKVEHQKARKDDSNTIASLQNEVAMLDEQLKEALCVEINVGKNKKEYNHVVRKCLYSCLLCNVSVSRCSDLISYLSLNLCHRNLTSMPSTSSVARLAYEVGVLSDIQTEHLLHESTVTTLSWDSTQIKFAHVNEVHVTVLINDVQQSLILSLSVLPGGATDDYYCHISNALFDVIKTYSDYYRKPEQEVIDSVLSSLKSTLTDRAPVNHCVVLWLEEELDIALLDLKCHVHPLDGLANAAKKVLSDLDETWAIAHGSSGKGGSTASLIYNISKLRYKQGSGDPEGFLTFLRANKLRPGIILRCVGNRLHVLFHMAATVFTFRTTLLEFCQRQCSHKLAGTIREHLSNVDVQVQLQALGWFSKFLTGPWMRVLYKNSKGLSNLEVTTEGLLSGVEEALQMIIREPSYILTCTHDAFGATINLDDPVVTALRTVDKERVRKLKLAVKNLAVAFANKLVAQMNPYLTGVLANPSAEMLAAAASAPVHNMHAERCLGMMDALWRRAPNANLGFIDGKVKGIQNKTLQWLESFPDTEQSKLITFAVAHGAKTKALRAAREKTTKTVLAKKLKIKDQKVEMANRKKLELDIKAVITRGDSLASLDEFKNMKDTDLLSMSVDMIKGDTGKRSIVGTRIKHTWKVDLEDVVYLEIVRDIKKKNSRSGPNELVVCLECWKSDGSETQHYHNMPIAQFLADVAFGSVVLF